MHPRLLPLRRRLGSALAELLTRLRFSATTLPSLQIGAVLAVISLMILLAAPHRALAQDGERILSYVSEIQVMPDSTLAVTETIKVVALGIDINHGIYRDFPTTYNDTMFKRFHVGFILDAVEHNGAPSDYHIATTSNGLRIYIGSSDEIIPHGEHEYTLKYRTIKQMGFYPDHDELYWNVTGTDWMFPIDYAEARIKLPSPVDRDKLELKGYTGPYLATGQDYSAGVDGPQEIVFRTTKPLGMYSGLTVQIGFPKGVVNPPSRKVLGAFWREEHKGEVFGMYGVPAVFVFLLICWLLAGVDPRGGTVTPRAEPPGDLSPAALRYIQRMGCDFTCFTAAVTALATKGYLSIDVDDERDYTLKRGKGGQHSATAEELALFEELFSGGDELKIEQDNHTTIAAAQAALKRALSAQYRRVFFFLNRHLSVIGILLSIGVLAGMNIVAPISALVVLPLFIAAVILIIITVIFWMLLPRYTLRGRRMLDDIAGFKLGLQYGTEAALGIKGDNAEELHEKFLPYAIALGAHQEWADRLEKSIRQQDIKPQYYRWYHDPFYNYNRFNYHDLAHNLAKSFTSSASSASVSPSSSSGGGGGFSGGGGGGGGGGGW